MTIQVHIKQVYGKDTVYPACDKARAFARLAGNTTLTSQSIQLIKSLGFTVQVVSLKPTEL